MLNRRVLFTAVPEGLPRLQDFTLDEVQLPEPAEGQILVRHLFIGLSPSARLRMGGSSDYGEGMRLGKPVQGQAVGIVTASHHPDFTVGQHVLVNGGWQEFSLTRAHSAQLVDVASAPASAALGLLGTSGMTAYVGMLDIGQPKPKETVVVSAASGSVGSAAGQIARLQGCRVVGIAGGTEKCAYVTDTLGFDACIDHRLPDLSARLAAACPAGVDISFENVGGAVRDAVWPLLNEFGRVAICGLIADYSGDMRNPGPDWYRILTQRLTVRGFLLRDHAARREEFLRDMSAWYRAGKILYREDITYGLENTPAAFIRLLQGQNFGKAVVALANAPPYD